MKIYNLKKLSFKNSDNTNCYPKNGTLVKCRGQIGICYTNPSSYSGRNCCKVYLLGANDLPEYGKRLCDAWSTNPHEYSPEGIIFNESK